MGASGTSLALARAHARVPRTKEEREDAPRFRQWEMEPPREAGFSERRAAYRAGRPISADTRFRNAIVYFAHFPELGKAKIGISNNVESRLKSLGNSMGACAVLLATLPGNRQEELRALEAFNRYKLGNEWFSFTHEFAADVERYVNDVLSDRDQA